MVDDIVIDGLSVTLPLRAITPEPRATEVETSHYFLDAIELVESFSSNEPYSPYVTVLPGTNYNHPKYLSPAQRRALRLLLGRKHYEAFLRNEELEFTSADLEYMKRVIEADLYEA